MGFEGQVVVITGAGRGIGYALAEAFAAERAQVVIAEKDETTGAAAAERLGAVFVPLDVSDAQQVRAAVDQIVRDHARIDIWINNAGIAHKGWAVELEPDAWDADIAVMLSGPFYCARYAGAVMVQQKRGCMINIASVNGLQAQKGRAPYCSAKAGLIMLTKVLASEWGEHGVRVNAVAPGVFMTDLVNEGIAQGLVSEETYRNRIPMGRLGEMHELIEAVKFLAGEEASFVTGEVLRVDGGWAAYHLFYPFDKAF
jgi:NAD(P)-dependent dehydrogenase (short-subunit alcohol dehydrogenase family)